MRKNADRGNHFKPGDGFRMFREKAKQLGSGLEVPVDLSRHAFFALYEKAAKGRFEMIVNRNDDCESRYIDSALHRNCAVLIDCK
jgi:hypothetical protein